MSYERRIPPWVSEFIPEELATSTVFQFDITLPNKNVVRVNLLTDIDIDYDMLLDQMEETPAQYMFWAALYSEMKSKVSIQERRLKAVKGKLTDAALDKAGQNKIKISVENLKTIIEGDPQIANAEAQLILLQKQTGKLWHMVEAIRMKSELLRSLAGFKKQERSES